MNENFFKVPSNTSLNSYSSLSCEERILKLIDESEIELTPIEISKKLHANHATVRGYLRKLLAKNLVVQPYPGSYCNKITYGVRFVPLCVHNVRLLVGVLGDVVHWEFCEVVGGVKVFVCFGSERRRVSGFVSCDVGMSRSACLLALHRWFDVVEERLGCEVGEVVVQSFEVNKDYVGLRLDGVQCVTKKGLFEMVERVYQKENNVIRREYKVSRGVSITEFEALLQGGVTGYNVNQGFFVLTQKLDRLTEALKFTNSQFLQLAKLVEAMYNKSLSG